MGAKLNAWLWRFQPPIQVSLFGAAVFSALSIVIVATDLLPGLPEWAAYPVYIAAALFLALAVRAIVRAQPRKKLMNALRSRPLTGKLLDDYSYRTVTTAYVSFGSNILLAGSKGLIGFVFSSPWFITFAVYNLILCVARFLLLRGRAGANRQACMMGEWKSYGFCGILLIVMTIVLQGAVVLIMRNHHRVIYYGVLIFVVALYDFYCLISSIVYMIRTRKKHTPKIAAIKSLRFAVSLVSMLSLQTAMFVSFGSEMELQWQNTMNLATGTVICLIILGLGVAMIAKSGREIKQMTEMETANDQYFSC